MLLISMKFHLGLLGSFHFDRGGHLRVVLAKMALNNLLTNLDLFPVRIDQCYYFDAAIADGYFTVLPKVLYDDGDEDVLNLNQR
ncbi:cell morphogenesis protein PAG1 isoform X4 [Tanacetum coccineum]